VGERKIRLTGVGGAAVIGAEASKPSVLLLLVVVIVVLAEATKAAEGRHRDGGASVQTRWARAARRICSKEVVCGASEGRKTRQIQDIG
jgi:hypothetical protein